MRKHSPTLFIECLATEIVETYKDLAGIAKNKKNNDFSCFLKIHISKLGHRLLIIFFQKNRQLSSL